MGSVATGLLAAGCGAGLASNAGAEGVAASFGVGLGLGGRPATAPGAGLASAVAGLGFGSGRGACLAGLAWGVAFAGPRGVIRVGADTGAFTEAFTTSCGWPADRMRRDANHAPVSAKQLALSLPAKAWKTATWREGTRRHQRSRFAAQRILPAHRDHKLLQPREQEWLLIVWPRGEAEPLKFWLSNLAASTRLRDLVALKKQR